MKRISILLVLALILSQIGGIAIADNSSNGVQEAALLRGLGIIEETDTDSLEEKITRAEFVRLLTDIVFNGNVPMGEKNYLPDVDGDHHVYAAYEMGLIQSYPDGLFRPTNVVLLDEATAIIVRLLGYEYQAVALGGYPTGYHMVAMQLRLLRGVRSGENSPLTKADVYVMLVNALSVDISETIQSGDIATHSVSKNKNLLTHYLQIYQVRGIITDNGTSSLKGTSRIRKNQVLIGDECYDAGDSDAQAFLGYHVRGYYKETDAGNVLIYVLPDYRKTSVVTIFAEQIIEGDASRILYEKDGVRQRAEIEKTADYIRNGISVQSITREDIMGETAQITLIDEDNDNIFEFLFIDIYTALVVKDINYDDYVLHGLYGEMLVADPSEVMLKVFKDGEESSFTVIRPYDVLAVYQTDGLIKLEICTKVVSADIQMIDAVQNEVISSDGKSYKIAREFQNSTLRKPGLGQIGNLYLDKQGRIVYFEHYDTDLKIGFLQNIVVSSGLDPTVHVKIFDAQGKWNVYTCRKKVDWNEGIINAQNLAALDVFKDGDNFRRQPILYRLDPENQIQELYVENTGEDRVILQNPGGLETYVATRAPGVSTLMPLMYQTSNTVTFTIPNNPNMEEHYDAYVGAKSYENNQVLNIRVYYTSESSMKFHLANIILRYVDDASGTTGHRASIVKDFFSSIDEEGNVLSGMIVLEDGEEKKVYSDGRLFNGVRVGDALRISIFGDTVISYAKMYSPYLAMTSIELIQSETNPQHWNKFWYLEDTQGLDPRTHYIHADYIQQRANYLYINSENNIPNYLLFAGTVMDKDGNSVVLQSKSGDIYPLYLMEGAVAYYRTRVYVFDMNTGRVTLGNSSDIYIGAQVMAVVNANSPIDIYVVRGS